MCRKALGAIYNVIKEFEPVAQAPFYLHKYHTRMGIGWRSAPTEIGNDGKRPGTLGSRSFFIQNRVD